MIFFGFKVSISVLRSRLFEAKLCGSLYSVCSAVVPAHVIRAGEACPKFRNLHRSPIFLALELLNAILITLKSLSREIYSSSFI